MALETLIEKIPDYANDIRLNLSSVLMQQELSPKQLWGALLSCALACKNKLVAMEVEKEASSHLTEQEINAAKSAAALMQMNNVFYRFNHLSSNERYRSMPARLRMNAIRTHGTDQANFELWSLAVSAINGCGLCVDSHENKLRESGVSEETIHAAVRTAAVINSVSMLVEN